MYEKDQGGRRQKYQSSGVDRPEASGVGVTAWMSDFEYFRAGPFQAMTMPEPYL